MPVTIDNISRLLEIVSRRENEGTPTIKNIKKGFDNCKITKGTDSVKFEENYDFCVSLELIKIEKENINITTFGNIFSVIPDIEQKKKVLREKCIAENKISDNIFSVLDKFTFKNKIYLCPAVGIMTYFKKYVMWLDLLYEIEFLILNRSTDYVEINLEISNTNLFKKLMNRNKLIKNKQRKPISLAHQEESRKNEEERNKKTGEVAEELVVKYEKRRLELEKFYDESSKVKQISEDDSSAGYDIESFFGKADNLSISDKLIEVKGTVGNKFRFFWSKNEIKTAKKLGKNYWIYFVINIDRLQRTGTIFRKIQDPFSKIFPLNHFDRDDWDYEIECDSYIISETLE